MADILRYWALQEQGCQGMVCNEVQDRRAASHSLAQTPCNCSADWQVECGSCSPRRGRVQDCLFNDSLLRNLAYLIITGILIWGKAGPSLIHFPRRRKVSVSIVMGPVQISPSCYSQLDCSAKIQSNAIHWKPLKSLLPERPQFSGTKRRGDRHLNCCL